MSQQQPKEFIILNQNDDFIYIMNTTKNKNIILPYEIDDEGNCIRFFFHTNINSEHRLQLLRNLLPLSMSIVDDNIYVELLHNLEFNLNDINPGQKKGIINFSLWKSDDDYKINVFGYFEKCGERLITDNFLPKNEFEYLDKFETKNLKVFPILCKNGNFILFVGRSGKLRLYFTHFESLIGNMSSIMVVKLIKYIIPYWRNIFKILYTNDQYIVSLNENVAEIIPNDNCVKILEYDYETVKLYG